MISLWLGAALLLVLAMAFLWLPAKRKTQDVDRKATNVVIFKDRLAELNTEREEGRISQDEFNQLKVELERNLLDDAVDINASIKNGGRWVAPAAALFLIVLSAAMYWKLGAYQQLQLTGLLKRMSSPEANAQDLTALTSALETQIANHPDDLENEFLLARIYADSEAYDKAVQLFSQILQQLPPEATMDRAATLAQLGQAQFFANGRKLDKATESLLKDAVDLNPEESAALGLLGIAAYERTDYRVAIDYWNKLLAITPESQESMAIRGGIEQAKQQLAARGDVYVEPVKAAVTTTRLLVSVDISAELKKSLPANATLFVLAKAMNGPKIPLAVHKAPLSTFPLTVELNDGMAMMPTLKISEFEKVQIIARISTSGEAMAKPGDLQGETDNVVVKDGKTSVVINSLVP
ncbi:MAG: c-type cytochrome biogenesis protein CcmI [Oceanospirillaceae bacterium]|nr:c-type cytochrome biogenesis protein CcmI [Oceanospirillaceae bacterium]